MGAMVTVGVVSLNASRSGTRLFAAARDVMAMVRRARSVALVTQKPVVIEYANSTVEDEAMARVEIRAEKLFSSTKSQVAIKNLAGIVIVESESGGEDKDGETLEDVLSPQSISEDVVRGLKLKVVDANEELEIDDSTTKRSKISIFSTADNVSRTYINGEDVEAKKKSEMTEAKQVVFSANGTVSPAHQIWIYPETSSPDKGLCVEVDRFGEPRCKDVDGM